jgi:uncharacterized protein
MVKNLNTPLSEQEIGSLDAFLATRTGPVRSFEGLDGLICALICAPGTPNHDEYITLVIGDQGDADSPQASDLDQMARRHYHTTSQGLQDAIDNETTYPPALMVDEQDQAMGNEWALGFLLGVSMTESHWSEFTRNEDLGRLIVPMMVLAHEHHPDPEMRPAAISDQGRDDLLQMMASSLTLIYGHFNGR